MLTRKRPKKHVRIIFGARERTSSVVSIYILTISVGKISENAKNKRLIEIAVVSEIISVF